MVLNSSAMFLLDLRLRCKHVIISDKTRLILAAFWWALSQYMFDVYMMSAILGSAVGIIGLSQVHIWDVRFLLLCVVAGSDLASMLCSVYMVYLVLTVIYAGGMLDNVVVANDVNNINTYVHMCVH